MVDLDPMEADVTEKQGTAPRKCKAKSKQTGKPCGNLAMRGQLVCRFHGGSSGQAKAKAEERQKVEKAEAAASRMLGSPITGKDARLVLLEEVWRTVGVVAWYEQEIQTLDRLSVLSERGESPHFLIDRHFQERRHLARTAKLAVDAGVQQELLDLAKEAADRFARALDGVLASLGHDPADPKVRDVVATQLRLVTASA